MDIYNLTKEELTNHILSLGGKKFNASQIYEWIYQKKATSFDEMSNISKKFIQTLKEYFTFERLELEKKQESRDGTVKYLFKLGENEFIETVLMRQEYGNSVCVTTQLGCNMGCVFCASGLIKKQRNLNVSEIVRQVLEVSLQEDIRVSHVVVMGIGEPFDNYDNTLKAIRCLNDSKGMQIGARHITVSTSGVVNKIKQFANEELQVNLAISLHAPNNQIRDKIMPINNKYDIESLIAVCKEYVEITNRRITFEYILLDNINDKKEYAHSLSNLLRGINCYVNIIPYNSVNENEYKRTPKDRANSFYDTLKKRGINCTLRKEQGVDIDAACGQLRSKNTK